MSHRLGVTLVAALLLAGGCTTDDGATAPPAGASAEVLPQPPTQRFAPDEADLFSFLHQGEGREKGAEAVARAIQAFPERCPQPSVRWTGLYKLVQPLQFEQGTLKSGSFLTPYQVSNCPKPRIVNVLYGRDQQGALRAVTLLPGTTAADPLLQRDAARQVLMMSAAKDTACKDIRLVYTTFEDFVGPPVADALHAGQRAWWETWTVWSCGKEQAIKINFFPNPRGTGFAIEGA